MILEWMDLLRTPATKLARSWGYASQSVALKFRAKRCQKHWQAHIENSRSFLLEFVQKAKPQSLVILGSGHLLEIPIQELLTLVPKIYLVDLVHPRSVRSLARKHPQLQLLERDLSSVLNLLKPGISAAELSKLDWPSLPEWDLPKAEAVISANLLSQLPLIISESVVMDAKQYKEFGRKVRDLHIQRMFQIAPKAALFADFETRYIDKLGQQLKKETYEVDVQGLKKTQEWLWEISPYGEVSRQYRIDMHVRAYWKF